MRPLFHLNPDEARVIDAIASHVIPTEPGSPGALEAGVVNYIDGTLAGFGRDLQGVYRSGLEALQAAVAPHSAGTFADRDVEQQRSILEAAEAAEPDSPDAFLGQFFAIVCEHVVQGFFGDPAYGGNVDEIGWRLVGYPGAQWSFTADQMRPGVDARSIPVLTVADLYSRVGSKA
jgi:gluconate 2-dehydrogenase gamma chain